MAQLDIASAVLTAILNEARNAKTPIVVERIVTDIDAIIYGGIMTSRYDVITFDCYGTLIDWNRGISNAFQVAARAEGLDVTSEHVLTIYHAIEPQIQAAKFQSYRAVLVEAAQRVAERLGWVMHEAAAQRFAASLPDWPAFPDTDGALKRLAAAGYILGILSNVDDDLLHGTLRQFSTPIDLIVTAQQVQSYKPAHGHFLEARRRIGEQRWHTRPWSRK